MFKKPKKGKKAFRKRSKPQDEDDADDTAHLIAEAKQFNKKIKSSVSDTPSSSTTGGATTVVMHQFNVGSTRKPTAAELATTTAQHHPEEKPEAQKETGKGSDGIFRDKSRNAFHAGPIRAATFVRTTARFDYQPDICKDYKETGFCGFGDTCIYLHDRGDHLTGWQLEQQWDEEQKNKQKQKEMDAFAAGNDAKDDGEGERPTFQDDGLPFACHICRKAFKDPIVTSCGHYFSEKCIMEHIRKTGKATCPICNKDTNGVFNQPTKLISKKRRALSSKATWEEYFEASKK